MHAFCLKRCFINYYYCLSREKKKENIDHIFKSDFKKELEF